MAELPTPARPLAGEASPLAGGPTGGPAEPFREAARRAWVRPAALLALFAAVFLVARVAGLPIRFDAEELRESLASLGLWAPAGLLAAYAIRPLLLVPITPLWIASGAAFGFVEGALLATAGTSLGAAIGFGLARRLGRDFVERRFGARIRRWWGMSFSTVFALQVTPVMPHDLINNVAGVSRVRYRSFFLGSLLGTIPVIAIYAYIGNAVLEIPSPRFWIAVALLTGLTITMLSWNILSARRRRAGGSEP